MKLKITLNDKSYDVDVAETATPGHLKVSVDGSEYEVDVEQYGAAPVAAVPAPDTTAPAAVMPAPAATPPAAQAQAPAALTAPAAPGLTAYDGPGTAVAAPMVGKILAVKVNPGDTVAAGDLLFLLEAMNMENEINSPIAGTVSEIAVQEGSPVKQGDLLCAIEES